MQLVIVVFKRKIKQLNFLARYSADETNCLISKGMQY